MQPFPAEPVEPVETTRCTDLAYRADNDPPGCSIGLVIHGQGARTGGPGGTWLGGCYGPPQQPRILILAQHQRPQLWTAEGWPAPQPPTWQETAAAFGVAVDAPLEGLTPDQAREFAARLISETPSWRYGLGAIARERLLAFVADLEEERNSFPGLDDAAGEAT